MDVEDFLEHHGVKGMRWGARRKSQSSNEPNRTKHFAKRAAIGAGIGVSAVAVGVILSRHGGKKISSPKVMPFMAKGKGWIVEAQDGRTFDMLVKGMTEQRLRR